MWKERREEKVSHIDKEKKMERGSQTEKGSDRGTQREQEQREGEKK